MLAGPYLLRRLAAPYLLSRLAAPYLLRRLAAPYLLRRHCSLVISYGTEGCSISSQVDGFDQRKHKVHEECLHRRIVRSVSIRDSRGVSPSEDHKECLYRRITRSVSIRGSQGVLHRRFTRSVSIGGSRGVSPSESTKSVSIRVIIAGFLCPTSLIVHTLELP
nr:hypothetical protein [Tanacetum cinerariifolium]